MVKRRPQFNGTKTARSSVEAALRRWRRSRTLRFGMALTAVAAIGFSIALALGYSGNSPGVPAINLPVPEIHVANLIPGAPSISTPSLEGRAVVLNFWGSWCPPCQREMPALEAAHRHLGDRVTFIGVDEHDSRSAATSFVHSVGVTYQIGFDANSDVESSFGVSATPTTYFISQGRELDFVPGELTKATLQANLHEWFGVT